VGGWEEVQNNLTNLQINTSKKNMRRVFRGAQRLNGAFNLARSGCVRKGFRRDLVFTAASLSAVRLLNIDVASAAFHSLVPYEGGDDDGT
jgi:hypothetical protein